jgi:hypothetical protein
LCRIETRFAAPIVVDAAGAWAEAVASLVGARPVGLVPKRCADVAGEREQCFTVPRDPQCFLGLATLSASWAPHSFTSMPATR